MKNIFNHITWQALKKNRTRTLITMLGVILSVTMISGVTTLMGSVQQGIVNQRKMQTGDWHVEFYDVDATFVSDVQNDNKVKNVMRMENVGYTPIQTYGLPYMLVTGINEADLAELKGEVIEGRFPATDREILIPEEIFIQYNEQYQIGNEVTLDLGKRMFKDLELGQNVNFVREKTKDGGQVTESFVKEQNKTYTIVGVAKQAKAELNVGAPAQRAFTKRSENKEKTNDIFVTLKKPQNILPYTEEKGETLPLKAVSQEQSPYAYRLNDPLVTAYGYSDNNDTNKIINGLTFLILSVIMIGAILLIYNAFAVSVGERTRQFGILSSIGATRKQLRYSVLFEAGIIGFIAIPIGLVLGFGSIYVVINIFTDYLTKSIGAQEAVPLSFSVGGPFLFIAIATSTLTIFISAFIPAQRATKSSAIQIIKQSDDIKIKPDKLKTSKSIYKVLGIEGALARKNIKRNKKRYRSITSSIAISVFIFITMSSFSVYLLNAADDYAAAPDYDIELQSMLISVGGKLKELDMESFKKLHNKLVNIPSVTDVFYSQESFVFGRLTTDSFNPDYLQHREATFFDKTELTRDIPMNIVFIEDDLYDQYLADLDVDKASYGIAQRRLPATGKVTLYDIDRVPQGDANVFKEERTKLHFLESMSDDGSSGEIRNEDFEIDAFDTLPKGYINNRDWGIKIFAPFREIDQMPTLTNFSHFSVNVKLWTNNLTDTTIQIRESLKDAGAVEMEYIISSPKFDAQVKPVIVAFIKFFAYTFVLMLAIIILVNMFNAISTSIMLRRREIAMLRSIGLSDKSFDKMMDYEVFFLAGKGLLYGLVVGLFTYRQIYRAFFLLRFNVAFIMPWQEIVIAIIGVVGIVFITLKYAISKTKKSNIIDALKDENA